MSHKGGQKQKNALQTPQKKKKKTRKKPRKGKKKKKKEAFARGGGRAVSGLNWKVRKSKAFGKTR